MECVVALRGDFAKFRRHIGRVERLGSPDAMRRLTNNLAEEAISLVLEGFQNETDPYGNKWQRKVFKDGRQVLVGSTTRLRRGWKRVRSDGRGFRISPSVIYAVYHQHGTGIYGPRKRRIEPTTKKVLSFKIQVPVARKARAGASPIVPVGKRAGRWRGQRIFLRSVKGCPKRLMVPRKGELPKAWSDAFIETSNEWFRHHFET
jgi:hypothetical protein